MNDYILAIDQGTSSTRAFLINRAGDVVARADRPLTCYYPKPGWVEQNPDELWQSVCDVINEIANHQSIAAIGITNQRETVVGWDSQTGNPVGNAIVWQCRRTSERCRTFSPDEAANIRRTTGLVTDPYFSATKMEWLLENNAAARTLASNGRLRFGTIDSFLTWKMSGGQSHITDITNASRTMLMNLQSATWDADMLKIFKIPADTLPRIVATSGDLARATHLPSIKEGTPITALVGDQQGALFGQQCTTIGSVKCTYGTGAFVLMNVGETSTLPPDGILSTVAWKINHQTTYAIEGSVFMAGSLVQWLRDGLGIISRADEIETLANSVADNGGVTIVPAFSGLGAPYWQPEARGIITGLTRGTTRGHIAKAALEAIALQVTDLVTAMTQNRSMPLSSIRVDGGACQNNTLMQLQANLLQLPVIRPANLETTVMGAAYLAGLGIGYWSADDVAAIQKNETQFAPIGKSPMHVALSEQWSRAIKACQIAAHR